MKDKDKADNWSAQGARVRQAAKAATAQVIGARGEDAIMDVTMLGPSGAGKTTLLASMYERFGRVIGTTDLAVVATDQSTSARMQEYLTALHSLTHSLTVKTGIAGTASIREYRFDVGRRGRRPLFTLRFTDYPGNVLMKPEFGSADDKEKIQRALHRADVVLVAIDVPALIELQGKYNTSINKSQQVTDEIIRMLQVDIPRLIILAPLKCERYVSSPAEAKNLAKRITEEYAPLLNYISGGDVRSRVGCVLTPVQTIGSVVFSRIEEKDDGEPVFTFHTRDMNNAAYDPVDTDQPLRYAMRFAVGKYRASAGIIRTGLLRILGTDAALVSAMQEFSAKCKTDEGFRVIQDHPFLHPERWP